MPDRAEQDWYDNDEWDDVTRPPAGCRSCAELRSTIERYRQLAAEGRMSQLLHELTMGRGCRG